MCAVLAERIHLFCSDELDRQLDVPRLQPLDNKLDRAMVRGGTEHRLNIDKMQRTVYTVYTQQDVCSVETIKMLRGPYSINEIVVHTHWALTDKMECKC